MVCNIVLHGQTSLLLVEVVQIILGLSSSMCQWLD